MIFYELVGFLTRTAYRSFRDIRFYRKIHKIARMMETGNRTAMRLAINLLKPKPLRSISRTFNTFSKAKRNDESEG